jgi:hypothetical protein
LHLVPRDQFEGPSGHLVAGRGHRRLVEYAPCVIVHRDWAAQFIEREKQKSSGSCVDGVIVDADENIRGPRLRIVADERSRQDQCVHDGGTLTTAASHKGQTPTRFGSIQGASHRQMLHS